MPTLNTERRTRRKLLLSGIALLLTFLVTLAVDRLIGSTKPFAEVLAPNSRTEYNTLEFQCVARTNALGLRDGPVNRTKGAAFRILAIGDSFTFGWGVAMDESWPEVLERTLQEQGLSVEVINAGKPGASPNQYARIAQELIPQLQPDLVLVAIVQGNDLMQARALEEAGPDNAHTGPKHRGWKGWVRKLYPNLTQRFAGHTLTGDALQARWRGKAAECIQQRWSDDEMARYETLDEAVKKPFLAGRINPYLINMAIQHPTVYLPTCQPESENTQRYVDYMAATLVQVKQAADAHGARLLAVSVPYNAYVGERELKQQARLGFTLDERCLTSNGPDLTIRTACDRADVPFITVSEPFRKVAANEALFYPIDGHFNPRGHEQFATLLIQPLKLK